jgi:hypothetical protein
MDRERRQQREKAQMSSKLSFLYSVYCTIFDTIPINNKKRVDAGTFIIPLFS